MKTNRGDEMNRDKQRLAGSETWEESGLPASKQPIDTARRTGGLTRLLFRLPVWLYRLRLGWLLGRRFLLINHVGRKSGRHYRTVVEVARHDPATKTYVVASGYGPGADWYRNLGHTPDVTIQVGRRRMDAHAELLSPQESAEEMVDYARRHPAAARNLTKMIGYEVDGSEADYRELGQSQIPFVALHTREQVVASQDRPAERGGLTAFFLIAFLVSWLVEVPLSLKALGIWPVSFPFSAHYLAAFGPMLDFLPNLGLVALPFWVLTFGLGDSSLD